MMLKVLKILEKGQSKVLVWYLLYSLIFVLTHLVLVSIFSFFHFLLEHEMGTIENWLSRNSWEIISVSKIFSLFCIYKFLQFNSYQKVRFWDTFLKLNTFPSKKSFGLIIFIHIIFYALMLQFGGGIKSSEFLDELFLASFVGSFIFFSVDVLCLFFIAHYFSFKIERKVIFGALALIIFICSSKIVLPYLSKYFIFLIVHFISLYYIILKENFGDFTLYLLFIISPMSSLLGMDLVWDNSYSIFSYSQNLPVIGILGIWCVALGYYRLSRLD